MKFELVNLTEDTLEMYNIPNIEGTSSLLIYDSLFIVDDLENYYNEYKINNISILINEDKLAVKWNDFVLNKEYSLKRLKYEFNDFYNNNRVLDKYQSADFLRKKRQLVISYLQKSGSEYQLIRDLLDRYNTEINLYVNGGTNDLKDSVTNETVEPFLSYLNVVVGVIPYTGQLETVKDSILRNIK